MSYYDGFFDALEKEKEKKKKKNTSQNTQAKKTQNTSTTSKRDDYTEGFYSALEEEKAKKEDIAPVKKTTESEKKYSGIGGKFGVNSKPTIVSISEDGIPRYASKEKKRTWFDKGVLDDGFQWSDIPKGILGTGTDATTHIGAGLLGIGEKVTDAVAMLGNATYQTTYMQQAMQDEIIYNAMTGKQTEGIVDRYLEEKERSDEATAEFVAKDLYNEEKIAKKIISAPMKNWTGIDSEKDSFFGDKTDALAQSGGQLLGQVAVSAIPGVGQPFAMGMMWASALGSEAESAFKQGATYDEALFSGLVSATAEVVTEKIGGISFGGKTLTDKAVDLFSRKATTKLIRALVTSGKLTADGLAEGGEELLSGYISALGQKLSYMEEKEIEELFNDDDKLESFIGGLVLGETFSGVSTLASDTNVSGMTKDEQSVVDKVYNNAIAEEEKGGKKLTSKEKNKIYDNVVESVQNGSLDIEVIEEALGGESYDAYKKASEDNSALIKERDELNEIKASELTGKQSDRLAELKGMNLDDTTNLDQLGKKWKDDVYNRLSSDRKGQGSLLLESYRERARRGQAFTADLSQYEGKKREAVERAIKSGVLNNTNRSHELVNVLSQIEADKGIIFDYTDNKKLKESGFALEGKTINGFVKDGSITLNMQSSKAWESTVGHEITHVLEGTKVYSELQTSLFEYAKSKGEFDTRKADIMKLYEKVKNADIDGELTAELVSDYLFNDKSFINHLTGNRTVFQKVWDEVKYLYKVATGKEKASIEKVMKEFDRAWKEMGKANVKSEGTKYSVSDKNIKDESTGYGYGETYFTMSYNQDGKTVATLEYGEYEGTPNVKMVKVDPEYRRQGIATKLLQELQKKYPDTEIDFGMTTPDGTKLLESITYDVTDDTVVAKQNEYKALQAELDELQGKLDVLYDTENLTEAQEEELEKLGDRWTEVYDAIRKLEPELRGKNATKTFVKYSVSEDSEGNQLSKEQSEYFKDSLVRDDNGNLLKVYHGSGSEFTVFNHKYLNTHGNAHGRGFYFTEKKSLAEGYSEEGGQLLEGYLNITKPLSEDKVTMKKADLVKLIKATCKAEAQEYVADGGYETVAEALPDTWISNYVDTYSTNLNDAYREVADIIYSGNDNDVEIISEITNAGAGNENTLKLTKDVLGYDGVIYTADDGTHEFVSLVSEQFKSADNINPTDNPDIRYSLSDIAPTKREPIVSKLTNKEISEQTYLTLEKLERGGTVALEELDALPEVIEGSEKVNEYRNEFLSAHPELLNVPLKELGTHLIDSAEREQLRNNILQERLKSGSFTGFDKNGKEVYNGSVEKGKRLDIVIGLPAAGKSTSIVNPLSQYYKSVVVDSDIIKGELPEFNEGWGASLVHEESSAINMQMLGEELALGNNIVLPIVGAKTSSVEKYLELAKLKGYEVHLHLNELNSGKAMGRMLRRYFSQGRFIPPAVSYKYGDKPTAVYEELKNRSDISGYSKWNNDVAKGQRPTHTDSSGNNRLFREYSETWRAVRGTDVGRNDSESKSGESQSNQIAPFNKASSTDGVFFDAKKHSLSNNGEQPSTTGTPLRDLYLEQDIAPIREDVAKNATATSEAPMLENIPVLPDSELEQGTIAAIRPKPEKQPSLKKVDNAESNEHVAQVLTEEPKVEKKKKSIFSTAVRNFIDKGAVFENLSLKTKNRALQDTYKTMGRSETKAQYFMENGKDGVKPLDSIIEEVEQTGKTQKFYEYLYHKHNIDRMSLESKELPNLERLTAEMNELKLLNLQENQLRAIASEKPTDAKRAKLVNTVREYLASKDVKNKPVFDYSVTAEMSQETARQLEKANPEFKEYAQDVYDYMNYLRRMMVYNGVISPETAELWAKMYPNYVPIRRADHNGLAVDVLLDTRKTGINAPIKGATGGNSDILPLFGTMAQRTIQTFKAIDKNRFGVELKNTLGGAVESTKTSLDEAIDSIDTHENLLQEGKNGQNPTFTVFEGGERVTFEITDEMYDALKPTSEGLLYTNKVLNTASNLHRGVLTEYNPVFMANNAIKDTQDVLINSQHPLETYANYPEAIKELTTQGQWYTEYMENGGGDNTYFDKQTNTFTEEKSGLRKVVGFPFEKISEANNFIEKVPRLAEYIASRKKGVSIEGAMLDAARVTTDFSAGGDVTKLLNRNGATFLNASVQGFAQQVRNVREAKMNGLKGWVGLATKYALAGLPVLLLNNLLWDDDEEYEELSDYVKDNYYVVAKYGDGKFVRIPKGRTLAVIQNAFEQVSNALTGNDEVDFNRFFDLARSNLAPNNPIDNNIIAPIIQAKTNKTWFDEDLVPTRLQDVPKAEQYDESTDAISKWLGEKINVSPYKINYLLNQYSGGIGDVFLPMMTPKAERGNNSFVGNMIAPLADKFTTDGVMNNKNVSDFYDTSDKLKVNANSSYATDEDILKSKYMSSVNAEMGELYKQKREIQNSNLSNAEKYNKVREIQKQINALAKDSLNSYEDVDVQEKYGTVGDRHYRMNKGTWEKITDKQLEEQRKITKDIDIAPTEYWEYKEGLSGLKTNAEKADYVNNLDMEAWQKNYLMNNDILDRKEDVDMTNYDDYADFEEFDYAQKNPEKYAVSKAVGGYDAYIKYSDDLKEIEGEKDANGKTKRGTEKANRRNYIFSLKGLDDGQKAILYRSLYDSADDKAEFDEFIIEYVNGNWDFSYEDRVAIFEALGYTVKDGQVNY